MTFSHVLYCSAIVFAVAVAPALAAEPMVPRRLPPVDADGCERLEAFDDIVPASFVTPVQRLSFGRMSTNDAQRFMASGVAQASAARLDNNFTSDPGFVEGIVVIGDDAALKIGGYVKADLIQDFDPIDSTDEFDTTEIPVGASPRENSRFHASPDLASTLAGGSMAMSYESSWSPTSSDRGPTVATACG